MFLRAQPSLLGITLALGCSLAVGPHAVAATPQLIWNDEFNQADGTGPDPSKWSYDIGVGNPPGWGNNELETYTNSRNNSLIVSDPSASDGKALAIRAQSANGAYTSARINTQTTYSFKYGRLEARARVPSGVGLWPAFWALGSNIGTVGWPACGEIDVMEWVGQTPTHIKGSLHAPGYSGGSSLNADYVLPNNGSYSDGYHTFAVDWYPDQIVFSMDGIVYETRKQSDIPAGSTWPFTQNFFILLNFAVGGTWPGPPNSSTMFPQDYLVDYVRVYALPATPPAGLVWAPSPPQNLSVSLPSATQADVAWQPPFSTFGAAITGYVLERANDSHFTQGKTSWNFPATGTSYHDSTVASGGTYYYRVSAMSVNGTSDPTVPAEAAAVPPAATSQPQSQTVAAGSTVVFAFTASGSPQYQWSLNGSLIPGATGSTFVLSGATLAQAGPYTCVATNANGSITSTTATLSVVSTSDPGRLINLSCRASAGTGPNILIAGFAVGPNGTSGSESLLVRASGPALTPFGVTGVLPDPKLQLFSGGTQINSNSGWGGNSAIAAAAAELHAFAWGDPKSNDSAILATETAGPYTAQVSGTSGDTGVALAEVYDATPAGNYTPSIPRLVNLSARVRVGTGANTLIAGFVVGGSTSKTVLLRASGPALVPFGVTGTLVDPMLVLKDQLGNTLASNSGWAGNDAVKAVAPIVGAFIWNSDSSLDSAILVTLPPGAYTAQVAGASGTSTDTGVALVEVYEVP